MTDAIRQARDFAIAAHGDQRYGARPYAYHLDMVAAILEPYGTQAQIVGYLHDTLEDTASTRDQIEAAFGLHVAACVAILTDEAGADRKTRKTRTYAKMAEVRGESELALIVKAADRLANVRACIADGLDRKLTMYREEHALLRAAVYRVSLCDALWDELDRALLA
jgi:guanosine-3',5'-bis(diphosphate) 3'-pyrophosphohydrolase